MKNIFVDRDSSVHIYGADFSPDERTQIAAALSKSAKRAGATWAGADSASVNTQVDERPGSYRTKRVSTY